MRRSKLAYLFVLILLVLVVGGAQWNSLATWMQPNVALQNSKNTGASNSVPKMTLSENNGVRVALSRPINSMPSKAELPTQNSKLKDIYPTLVLLANAGDARAACRLAFELDRCSKAEALDKSSSALEESLKKLDTNEPSYKQKIWMVNETRKEADLRKAVCSGYVESNPEEGARYALQAALTGSPEMRVRYVLMMGTALDHGQPEATAEGWLQYRDNARQLLQSTIDEGYPQAYETAAFNYLREPGRWRLVQPDPVKGLSFYFALIPFASPAYKDRLEQNIQYMTVKHKLSNAEIVRAREMSGPLMAALSASVTSQVDFTSGSFKSEAGSYCDAKK